MFANQVNFLKIADRIHGQLIVGAPVMCSDKHEFLRGAQEQADNLIDAIADAMAGPGFGAKERAVFIKRAKEGMFA